MNPQTITKLRENIPELRELVAFLKGKAEELNTLYGLDLMTSEDRAIEATARLRAYNTLYGMLAPLIDTPDKQKGVDPKEYAIEVK